ncbi:multicopper oxidase family protein [Paenibacillus sp.]|uniref:multicopper oxidase family protein n=1 Tax=Paenibacillus sp. TaxID=58172 RepID=UPI002D54E618|nr:multicopper oxidase family protein [Paenibacillus sp.]HZG86310.1 multicopper oxidase family protein [Paenibacillus sp.]
MHRTKRSAAVVLLVLAWLLASCGTIQGRPPEEIDMSAPHAGHAGHDGTEGQVAAALSCPDLIDPPSAAPVREFELQAAVTRLELNDGTRAEAWTFNGSTPGPELRVREGDRVVVKLTNVDIEAGVSIHWHGVVLPCSQDGVPGVTQDAVWPGGTFTYSFIAKHPGTYWYHSHQQSSRQAKRGLIGRLIVEPKDDPFAYDRDYAVTLQELNEKHRLTNGAEGGLALEAAPGETVRLRLVNAFDETQRMGVAGAEFRVASIDANDLNAPTPLRNEWIPIGGGQRYDLLITMPDNGQVVVYSREHADWRIALGAGPEPERLPKDADTFDFTTYGEPKEDGISADMAFDRTYELELGPVTINGKGGHHIPPMLVKEGDWVKVRIKHRLGADHPMHLHGHVFKIVTKNGRPLTGSPIYADSVPLSKGDEYEVVFQADNPGLWMLHCHNLGHAAAGMTMMLNYKGVSTPYRVGTKSGNLPD